MNNPQNLLQLRVTDKKFVYDRDFLARAIAGGQFLECASRLGRGRILLKLFGQKNLIDCIALATFTLLHFYTHARQTVRSFLGLSGVLRKSLYDRVSHPHFPKP